MRGLRFGPTATARCTIGSGTNSTLESLSTDRGPGAFGVAKAVQELKPNPMMRAAVRPLAGLATIVAIIAVVAVAVALFQGGLTRAVPLTVLSQRAGLVMNPDAKVKLLGVQVGRVASIEQLPNGGAAIHLLVDPDELSQIPDNVRVDIGSTTVFGAKSVNLVPPAEPSSQSLQPGQAVDAERVTVEFNTIFEQLTSVLSKIQPEKLNETLGAIATAMNGRGQQFGQMLGDLDELLARLDPSLPNLNRDFELAPTVLNAYADAAPDLIAAVDNTTRISQTLIDEQQNLDALLVSATGLADIGNDVIGTNRSALTDLVHLLVPTTDLTNEYNQALYCGLGGLHTIVSSNAPFEEPGAIILASLVLGRERWRYPSDLPKVAATGGPQCGDLPRVPAETRPPFVVTDVGANPWQYGNQGILLNSDGLKQMLFGPIDGPPRNSTQIGQPG
jgi:phospholipid/cholesterol/gamma-HCH transport system substrate-binding protein